MEQWGAWSCGFGGSLNRGTFQAQAGFLGMSMTSWTGLVLYSACQPKLPGCTLSLRPAPGTASWSPWGSEGGEGGELGQS